MSTLKLEPWSEGSFEESLRVPGDKSMSHRAAMLGGLASGRTQVEGFLPSEDCLSTLAAMQAMGVEVLKQVEGDAGLSLELQGVAGELKQPQGRVDCGNSGTTMRLLSGVLASQSFEAELFGDASLSKRPMGRIIDPLSAMGASFEACGEKRCPPLKITGGALTRFEYELPVASAQVKSAVLLAGLLARETVAVVEPVVTRDHTERMLRHFGITVERDGQKIVIPGGQTLKGAEFVVPGDVSSAAFWMVLASFRPGASLTLRQVGLNPSRDGVIHVLKRMGANIKILEKHAEEGEPYGDLLVQGKNELHGTRIGGDEIPNVIDELPILAVAAALAKGETVIADAGELRVKETDRIAVVSNHLKTMGVEVEEKEDGMVIQGGGKDVLQGGASLESYGDHRMAMAFAIAASFANGETEIRGAEAIATSYPSFMQHWEKLKAASEQGGGA